MTEGTQAASAGALLRAARESRGLHIAALAAAIKVTPRKLDALVARGCRLAIATSKPEANALEILAHLDLADRFTTIVGDTLDGRRGTKALVVGEALRRLGDPDPSTVLMVGDRHHDVEGSRVHGVDCAGVLWGYGTPDELTAAGAWALCASPPEVAALLG